MYLYLLYLPVFCTGEREADSPDDEGHVRPRLLRADAAGCSGG